MAPAVLLIAFWLGPIILGAVGLLWLFWAICACYLLVLAVAARLYRPRPSQESVLQRKFCILIPAHDEAVLLGGTLDRLRELDYPAESWTVVVIADNCGDNTADIAREHGAEVLDRTDSARRGKGYALEWASGGLLADPRRFDAFVIMDADSVLSPAFLRVMDSALDRGDQVIQGRYDVRNVDESWRTRLMAAALALAHYVKPLGRMTLGLSDGLKGNGMCFSREALKTIPWSGESITEDIDQTLRLIRAGYRIRFAPQAIVSAQMPATSRQAAGQRARWEAGRYALSRKAVQLLFAGIRARSAAMIDRAAELLIPPLAELFAVPLIGVAAAAVWAHRAPESPLARIVLWGWVAVLAIQMAYVVIGMAVARVPRSVAISLVFAPFYVAWKLGLYAVVALRGGPGGWHRTERRPIEEPRG